MTKLSIIYVNRKDIMPYINNPRIHDEKHINQIVSSIKTFDFTNPILLDENNEILAGHGRFLAVFTNRISSICDSASFNDCTEKSLSYC